MKNLIYLFCFLIVISCDTKKEILEKGISYDLAKYRKQQISDVIYNLHFKIPEKIENSIPSKLKVDFNVKDLQENVF